MIFLAACGNSGGLFVEGGPLVVACDPGTVPVDLGRILVDHSGGATAFSLLVFIEDATGNLDIEVTEPPASSNSHFVDVRLLDGTPAPARFVIRVVVLETAGLAVSTEEFRFPYEVMWEQCPPALQSGGERVVTSPDGGLFAFTLDAATPAD
ncbi:MAG: hypothetical protein HC813_01790 [Planctomycetes bacterium]|nr:hypothetical protein [Planctomycetota bacterium]